MKRDVRATGSQSRQLTADQAAEIFDLRPDIESLSKRDMMMHCKQIGPIYGATPRTIRDIWHKRTWQNATRHLWSESTYNIKSMREGTTEQPAVGASNFCCQTLQAGYKDFGSEASFGAERQPRSQPQPTNIFKISAPGDETVYDIVKTMRNHPPHGNQDLPRHFPSPAAHANGMNTIPANSFFYNPYYLPVLPYSALAFQPPMLSPRPSTPPPWLYPQRQSPSTADLMAMILSSLLCPAVPAAAASPRPLLALLLPREGGAGLDLPPLYSDPR